MKSRAIVFLSLLVAVQLGCGRESVATERDGSSSGIEAIVYGEQADASYSNVGDMVIKTSATAPWTPLCSGTLIAPNVFLTAGHCVFIEENLFHAQAVGVTFDSIVTPASEVIPVSSLHAHPSFQFAFATPSNPADNSDVGILMLSQAAGGRHIAKLPPPGLFDDEDDGGPEIGTPVAFVGYGRDTPDFTPATRFGGTRRVGNTVLRAVYPSLIQVDPNPSAGCGGDSGGPAFIGRANSHGHRVVTHVDALLHNATCATYTMFYRLDTPQARSFLGQFVKLPN